MVYGAGALGTCATAILRTLHPDVEVLVVDEQGEIAMTPELAAIVTLLHPPRRDA